MQLVIYLFAGPISSYQFYYSAAGTTNNVDKSLANKVSKKTAVIYWIPAKCFVYINTYTIKV